MKSGVGILVFCGAICSAQAPSGSTSATAISAYINPGKLQARNRPILTAIGNRLQSSGSERVVFAGTLAWGTSQPTSVLVTTQWPNQIRIDPASGGPIIFNGTNILKSSAVTLQDEQLVNSLVFDFVDHYLLGQQTGFSSRAFGPARVTDPSVTTPTVWAVVQVLDQSIVSGTTLPILKHFGFNTATEFLENVSYTIQSTGDTSQVQTKFGSWQTVQKQALPTSILRIENGTVVFTFRVTSATLAAASADGLLSLP